MIESLWSCLLLLASCNRETRPLALVLGVKALLNYSAAAAGFWLMPPLIDLAAGAVGVVLSVRLPRPVLGSVLAATFVVAPLAHAWHWGLWSNGIYVGVQYWIIMLGLFTAQTLLLALPEGQDFALAVSRHRRIARRRSLARMGSASSRSRTSFRPR